MPQLNAISPWRAQDFPEWYQQVIKAADMDREKFNKEYAYGFRHMYGKEGARKNYTPFTCLKIILGPAPAPGVAHGCPYKHLGDQSLRAVLSQSKLGASDAESVFKLAKEGHYQLACERYFDIKHPNKAGTDLKIFENVASHTNAYFTGNIVIIIIVIIIVVIIIVIIIVVIIIIIIIIVIIIVIIVVVIIVITVIITVIIIIILPFLLVQLFYSCTPISLSYLIHHYTTLSS